MPPYDATGKELIELNPAGWLAFLGWPRPAERVSLIDADLSVVSAAADKVIRVADDPPWLVHLELQSGWDDALPARTLMYNAILHARHAVPVASVVVLMRPAANAAAITGALRIAPPAGEAWEFRYTVVRVWTLPTAELLAGPLATLPLAPVSAVHRAGLPAVIDRMKERTAREANPATYGKLWAATAILMGSRYEEELVRALLEGIMGFEDSTVVQGYLRRGRAEGKIEEAREMIFEFGRARFGPPPAEIEQAVSEISDVDRLKALARTLATAAGWEGLLPSNPTP